MKKNFKFGLSAFALILMLAMLLAACGGNNEGAEGNSGSNGNNASEEQSNNNSENSNENSDEGEKLELGQEDLTIPYVAWARESISTEMLAQLLEKVGYNVETKQVEAGPMFSSVAKGSADLHTSAWLPATHQSYWEDYSDDLVKVKQVLDKAPLALTVPSYVESIESMKDLKDNEEFGESVDWKITGIDPGAGIMQNTEEALKEYGLDNWELTTASESAMLAELQSAMENEEPIIVPLWKPHWAFGDMDLRMLDDSKEIYGGDGDQIFTLARKGLEEDAPRAYKVLEQYNEDYDMLDGMMPKVYVEERDVSEVVTEFIDNNPDRVDEWLDGITTE